MTKVQRKNEKNKKNCKKNDFFRVNQYVKERVLNMQGLSNTVGLFS